MLPWLPWFYFFQVFSYLFSVSFYVHSYLVVITYHNSWRFALGGLLTLLFRVEEKRREQRKEKKETKKERSQKWKKNFIPKDRWESWAERISKIKAHEKKSSLEDWWGQENTNPHVPVQRDRQTLRLMCYRLLPWLCQCWRETIKWSPGRLIIHKQSKINKDLVVMTPNYYRWHFSFKFIVQWYEELWTIYTVDLWTMWGLGAPIPTPAPGAVGNPHITWLLQNLSCLSISSGDWFQYPGRHQNLQMLKLPR